MPTITIPQKGYKEKELIAIPRREYEEFLAIRKFIPVVKMTSAEKREWKQAKKDYEEGKYVTLEELRHELGSTHKRRG